MEDYVTVRALPWELMTAATMYLQCLSIRTFKVTGTTLKVKVAELLPAGVQEVGGTYDRNFCIFALEILMTGHLFNLYLCFVYILYPPICM